MKKGLIFYINWILFQIYSKIIFKIERCLYKKFRNKKIKRRIFLSSGNISLINVLTIIKQFPEKNTEDILVIDTLSSKKEFIDINLKAASLHKFKKIIINIHTGNNKPYFVIMKHNLFKIDEIYAHPKLDYIRFIQPMFPECKYILFDEGIGSLIEIPHPNNKYISEAKFMKYNNKLDRFGWENLQINNLNTDIFKELSTNLTKMCPFDLQIDNEAKTVVFCGAYWQQFSMGKNEFYNYQNSIMKKLLDNGFDVIYKPHPRDIVHPELPCGVKIINNRLPLELYNIDVLAIISLASSVSLQMYHYWNIPGFTDICNIDIKIKNNIQNGDVIQSVIGEYTPNIAKLLEINANNYTKENLKNMLNKIMENTLALKPMLNQNNNVKFLYDKYLKQEEMKFGKQR